MKTKAAKAAAAKERKAMKGEKEKVKKEKGVKEEKDEFDDMADKKTSLNDSGKKMKQSKLAFKTKEKPKVNPWSEDEDDDEISGICIKLNFKLLRIYQQLSIQYAFPTSFDDIIFLRF